jgi:hypothetical protein
MTGGLGVLRRTAAEGGLIAAGLDPRDFAWMRHLSPAERGECVALLRRARAAKLAGRQVAPTDRELWLSLAELVQHAP